MTHGDPGVTTVTSVERLATVDPLAGLLARPRFELVPIKGVDVQLPHLPDGGTVTVTVSPRRGHDPTLDLCERLSGLGFRAVPHVAARLVSDPGHLADICGRIRAAGIREVFVVGGDPPEPAGPYDSALSLLAAMDDQGFRFEEVGVAGYPERHPLVDDETMFRALLDKQSRASYVVTQLCYQPGTVLDWIGRIRRAGVSLPVYVGMPGVVRRSRLLEISLRVGVGDSIRYLRKQGRIVGRLMRRGGWRPDPFARGIAEGVEAASSDVMGFHINTFNQVQSTERWRQEVLTRAGATGVPASEGRAHEQPIGR